jgi:zinc protease
MTLTPGVKHETAEEAVHGEIEKLKNEDVSPGELTKARNIIVSQLIYLRDSPLGVASAISEAEAVADWKFYVDLPAMVEAVTASDIRRIANEYFTIDNRTVGYFIPKE